MNTVAKFKSKLAVSSKFNEIFRYEGLRQMIFGFKNEINLPSKKKQINQMVQRIMAVNVHDNEYEPNVTEIEYCEQIRKKMRENNFYITEDYISWVIFGISVRTFYGDVKRELNVSVFQDKYLKSQDGDLYDIETQNRIGFYDGEIHIDLNEYVAFDYDADYVRPLQRVALQYFLNNFRVTESELTEELVNYIMTDWLPKNANRQSGQWRCWWYDNKTLEASLREAMYIYNDISFIICK